MLCKIVNPALASTNGFNTDHSISEANQDTSIVKEPEEGSYWVLDRVQCSYSSVDKTPEIEINGGLIVKDGDKVVIDLDISQKLVDISFYIPASPGKDLTVELKKAGQSMVGKLNIQCHLEGI